MRVGVIASDGTFSIYEAETVEYADGELHAVVGGKDITLAELTPEEARSVFRILARDGVVRIHLGEHPMIYGRD
ncbi:MAG: hypothetical protein J7K48_04670 [Thermococcus sp.]|nr:hypothetical protein [Thermococcus sp.]